jgi:hypothetical protein
LDRREPSAQASLSKTTLRASCKELSSFYEKGRTCP